MALVRVYLFYYRRPRTVERALRSLLAQTMADWACEFHNDDPSDDGPRQILDAICDPRIAYVPHRQNLGAVASFNLAWKPIDEPFMSVLEDDNWWEPEFLQEMISVMDAHATVDLAWANMTLWRERPGNNWESVGTIWDKGDHPLQLFWETQPRQMMEPLHSEGAMLVRTRGRHMVPHPASTPLFIIEALRERCIRGPLLLNRRPLANFALTVATARQEDLVEKTGAQALMVADFLRKNEVSRDFLRQAWCHKWWSGRYALRSIIVGGLLSNRAQALRYVAFSREFFLGVLWFIRHPVLTARIARYVLMEKEISGFLRQVGHEFRRV
jgi:glycosyltransferase involved in cell wall biosynthesis